VAHRKIGDHCHPFLEPHRASIEERLRQTPHPTLHGLKDELAGREVVVSLTPVWQYLRREGLRKNNPFAIAWSRADIVPGRARWTASQGRSNPCRLVFINET